MTTGFRFALRFLLLVMMIAVWGLLETSMANADLLSLLHPKLGQLRQQRSAIAAELERIGPMEMGPTCAEIGSQYHMVESPPTVAPWIQLDLGYSRSFDSIMIVPAIAAFSESRESVFAFPPVFRIDVSDTADFSSAQLIYQADEQDQHEQLGVPVVIQCGRRNDQQVKTRQVTARYIRVTVNQLAKVSGRWTFALGEIMVLDGDRNIAIESSVTMKQSPALMPKWDDVNLIDGRTPLGAPIKSDLPDKDGVYTVGGAADKDKWMLVDLGKVHLIDEIRLHPIYARQGANLPGYAFPKRFRIETAIDETFANTNIVFDSGQDAFSNPGDNPVTFPASRCEARFVRVVCIESWDHVRDDRFGLSELQVYSGDKNVAAGASATIPGDLGDRPAKLLTDGYDSLGQLIELSRWVKKWERYRQLRIAKINNEASLEEETPKARTRLAWASAILFTTIVVAGFVCFFFRRRRQQQQHAAFREHLARDLHDEIGSNLAAIARLGEVAQMGPLSEQASKDWNSVSQMANECTDSMRETLWLLGARQEQGGHLPDRLQLVAKRMLPHAEIKWDEQLTEAHFTGAPEINRELFLMFKEIIANVAKHAEATQLDVSFHANDREVDVSISDNGTGFTESLVRRGMGLDNIFQRIKKLRGTVDISTQHGHGTTIRLSLPLPADE